MNRIRLYIAICILLVLFVFLFLFFYNPTIYTVTPNIASPGDIIEIKGHGFGKERGRVIVGDMQLLNSSLLLWSDRLIRAKLPVGVSSGFVQVFTAKDKNSNRILFALKSDIPRPEGKSVIAAEITDIKPEVLSLASKVVVMGHNLDTFKDRGTIYVTWIGKDIAKSSDDVFYPVPNDYVIKWESDKIEFFLPEAATSGEVFISDGENRTNGIFVDVNDSGGRFYAGNALTYSLEFDMSFSVSAAESGAAIVWLPGIAKTFWQRNIRVLEENIPPYLRDKNNIAYRFSRTQTVAIKRGIVLDIYPVWTSDVDENARFSADEKDRYTIWQKNIFIDKKNNLIASLFDSKDYSPYEWVWKCYIFVRDRIGYRKSAGNSLDAVLQSGLSDSLGRARLLVQLLRAGDVPARVVGGILLQSGGNLSWYYWAEAALPAMGWVPVDPTAPFEAVSIPSDSDKAKDLYFLGGLSAQHLLMFREGDAFPAMIPGSQKQKNAFLPALWEYSYELRNSSISDIFFNVAVAGVY
ncbi:transglutaminase domain-containing protein [Spirochaetia bacterium 38H-sp]|uniref:Transglutaminase domain-containing protein n=1 Tax=Rarispira pelagica TaxID=3141764 RepID=A0ABU9UC46_9SPIR